MAASRGARAQPLAEAESAEFLAAARMEADRAVLHRQRVVAHVGAASFTSGDFCRLEPNDWKHSEARNDVTPAELQLGKRCHGAHLETLAADVTPAGSHYLLIHYDVPLIDAEAFRLKVHGLVEREVSLSMADIKCREAMTSSVLLACAGNGRMALRNRFTSHVPWGQDAFGCAKWTGCSLGELLKEVGLKPGAAQVVFTGADKGVEQGRVNYYQRSLTLEQALTGHVLLCWQMNGADLMPCHGAPLRIIVPGWYGMASVKWLTSIEVTAGGWWGTGMEVYCYRRTAEDPGRVPLEQLPVRAMLKPPGCPDFYTRTRLVEPGIVRVGGRAWAGAVDISRVEFSSDGGETWTEAEVGAKTGPFGWAAWHCNWDARAEGTYVLTCRAVDARGRTQDDINEEQFNYTGMGCTQPQLVYVKVTKAVERIGESISLGVEERAAKDSSLMQPSLWDALYRAPGSQ